MSKGSLDDFDPFADPTPPVSPHAEPEEQPEDDRQDETERPANRRDQRDRPTESDERKRTRADARTREPARDKTSPELAALHRLVDVEARRYVSMHRKLAERYAELAAAIEQARNGGAETRDLRAWLEDVPEARDVVPPALLKRPRPAATAE